MKRERINKSGTMSILLCNKRTLQIKCLLYHKMPVSNYTALTAESVITALTGHVMQQSSLVLHTCIPGCIK